MNALIGVLVHDGFPLHFITKVNNFSYSYEKIFKLQYLTSPLQNAAVLY